MSVGSRFVALAGGAALIALSASPALAATVVSQATAQALASSSGGQSTATPTMAATNDGTRERVANPDQTPAIATSNPAVSDVAPQLARAYEDGTSTACAGLTGPGSQGVTHLTASGCTIQAKEFKLHLADLDLTTLLNNAGVVGSALSSVPGLSALPAPLSLDSLTSSLTSALGASSLGSLQITADLGSISGRCAADPARAVGSAEILNGDSASTQPAVFAVTIPTATGGVQTLPIVELPANPAPNTHVVSNFDSIATALTDAVTAELNAVVGSQLTTLGVPNVAGLADTIRTSVVSGLLSTLSPVTKQLKLNLVDVILNKQTVSAGGRRIDVSALDGLLVPLTASASDPSTVMLNIGHVTCGVNAGLRRQTPTPPPAPATDVPMSIDAGHAGHTGSWSLADTTAAVTAALTATTLIVVVGYRRAR